LFALIRQLNSDLLPNALTFKRQILSLQTLLFQFEDVPLVVKQFWFSDPAYGHRAHERFNHVFRKPALSHLVFTQETDVSTLEKTLSIFALRSGHGRKIGAAFQLRIESVDLCLGRRVAFRIVLRNSLGRVVTRIDHDYGQPCAAFIHE